LAEELQLPNCPPQSAFRMTRGDLDKTAFGRMWWKRPLVPLAGGLSREMNEKLKRMKRNNETR
jgi:hypothetical protein